MDTVKTTLAGSGHVLIFNIEEFSHVRDTQDIDDPGYNGHHCVLYLLRGESYVVRESAEDLFELMLP